MYAYRNMTDEQREHVIAGREQRGYPPHSPPHLDAPNGYRIVTATCFEHASILDSEVRLASFEDRVLHLLSETNHECAAWVILPNHYHLLVKVRDIKVLSRDLGQLHGSTSFKWNSEDMLVVARSGTVVRIASCDPRDTAARR